MVKILFRVALGILLVGSLLPLAFGQGLQGTYVLVRDSDGTVPKKGAVVTLSFKGGNSGTLSMSAVQPGEQVADTGKYSAQAGLITIEFKEMEWEAAKQPFALAGCTLTLPFKALDGTPGPGTSTWQKQAPGCSQAGAAAQSSSALNAGSMPAQQSQTSPPANQAAPKRDQASKANASSQGKKESCATCTYVPCIKALIQQKQALQEIYGKMAAEYGKFYFQTDASGNRVPVDSLDSSSMSLEDKAYLFKLYANYAEKETEMTAGIEVPHECGFEESTGVEIGTGTLTCQMDNAAAARFEEAMPCPELYTIALSHEAVHIQACQKRQHGGSKGGPILLTPVGKAKEEIAAYQIEIKMLNDLLKKAESDCHFTCRCTGERFKTSLECQHNCPISLNCPVSAANSCMLPDPTPGKAGQRNPIPILQLPPLR